MQNQNGNTISPTGAETQKPFDILVYLQVLRNRKWHCLFFLAAVVGLTIFYTLRQPKVYRATATVQIDPQAPRVLGHKVEAVTEMGTGSYWSNEEYYETQYHVIRSFEVASRVVSLHSLGSNRAFLGIPEDEEVFEPVCDITATEMLRGMITAQPVKDSRLVNISVDHTDPGLAQLLANAVAQAYIEYNRDVALESTVNARDWLVKQAEIWAKTLRDAEQRAVDFRKLNNLLSVSLEDQRNQIANEMDWVTQRLSETRSRRQQLEAKKAEIEQQIRKYGIGSVSIAEVLASPVLQAMKQRLFEKNLEREALAQIAAENWPEMRQRDTELATIRNGIREEVQTILRAIDADYTETVAYEQQLQARADQLQEQAIALASKELQYTRLLREKENAERIYQLINQRSEETTLTTELSQVNNVRVLDPALRPKVPILPRVKLNIAVAIVIGLIGGIGLAFLLEALDTSVKTQEDVEKGLGLAFLGIIPTLATEKTSPLRRRRRRHRRRGRDQDGGGGPELFCHDNPKSAAAECCRSIRTNILFMSPDRPPRKLLVTSASPQEGKTTVAVSLAITMAQSGSRVLLVDSDMRRPRIQTVFGIENEDGLSTAILGTRKVEDLIRSTQVPGLDVLPCGPIPPNPAELLHTERFREVVGQLERIYDRLIFDSPPVIAVTDPVILSRHVDGVVLVVKSTVTNRRAARFAAKQIRDVGGNLLGAVLNDLDLENRDYGYHDYYYRKFGYYYGTRHDEAKKPSEETVDEPAAGTDGNRAPPPAAPGS